MAARLDDAGRIRALERLGLADATSQPALEALAGLARDLLNVDVVLVSMVDDYRQVFKAAPGLAEPWSTRPQSGLSHSFCQHVAITAEPLVVEDARLDQRVARSLAIEDIGVIAYAGVPVRDPDGHVLGSFCAIEGEPRAWTEAELVALRRHADVAERIIDEQPAEVAAHGSDALLDHVRFARRLQRALLPRQRSATLDRRVQSAYQPGTQRQLLGGDFVDVLEHPDGELGFVVGDVCGHGPESAAFAIALRAAWSTLEQTRPALPSLASSLNAAALNQQPPDSLLFATVLLGRMPASGAGTQLLSAGHPPPVDLSGHPRELDLPAGMAIGVAEASGDLPAAARQRPRPAAPRASGQALRSRRPRRRPGRSRSLARTSRAAHRRPTPNRHHSRAAPRAPRSCHPAAGDGASAAVRPDRPAPRGALAGRPGRRPGSGQPQAPVRLTASGP